MAERAGFEPALPCGKRAFQARALGQLRYLSEHPAGQPPGKPNYIIRGFFGRESMGDFGMREGWDFRGNRCDYDCLTSGENNSRLVGQQY